MQFEEIYTPENRRRMMNLCHRILRSPEDAEDVVQDAFINALNNLHAWRQEASITTWLCTIARNKAIEYRRRETRVEFVSLNFRPQPDSPFTLADLLPADDPSPEWHVFVREAMEALNTLCPEMLAPMNLRIQGYSVQEIGAIMGTLSAICIRGRIFRAQRQLRKKLRRGK
jgi:RNA polymerase sigma-70 factor, ECF subfamily